MMYECQLTIFLTVITNNRRSLEESENVIQGTCTQTGTAEGSLNEKQTLKGSTASVDCETEYGGKFNELKLKNVTIDKLNGDVPKDNKVDANAAFEINIMEEEDAKYEEEEEIDLYVFEQNYQTCKCKDGVANFQLKGKIENHKDKVINGVNYSLTTSEEEEAKCSLTKLANSNEATLDCQVKTSTEKFNFTTGEDTKTHSDSSIALEMDDDSVSCSESSSSSSSGLSGGAIAGIVIGSIAGVLILSGIAVFVALGVKSTGAAAAAAVSTTSAASSEAAFPTGISSNKIPL